MKFTAAANFLGCLSIGILSGRGIIRVEGVSSIVRIIMRGGLYYCCLHIHVMWDVKEIMETLLFTHSSTLVQTNNNLNLTTKFSASFSFSITGRECIMIIFPYVLHLLSFICRSLDSMTALTLLCLCFVSLLCPSHRMWVHYDIISLCASSYVFYL